MRYYPVLREENLRIIASVLLVLLPEHSMSLASYLSKVSDEWSLADSAWSCGWL